MIMVVHIIHIVLLLSENATTYIVCCNIFDRVLCPKADNC